MQTGPFSHIHIYLSPIDVCRVVLCIGMRVEVQKYYYEVQSANLNIIFYTIPVLTVQKDSSRAQHELYKLWIRLKVLILNIQNIMIFATYIVFIQGMVKFVPLRITGSAGAAEYSGHRLQQRGLAQS